MMKTLVTAGAAGFLAVPALAVLVALGVGSSAVECIGTSAGGPLAQDAPVPTDWTDSSLAAASRASSKRRRASLTGWSFCGRWNSWCSIPRRTAWSASERTSTASWRTSCGSSARSTT